MTVANLDNLLRVANTSSNSDFWGELANMLKGAVREGASVAIDRLEKKQQRRDAADAARILRASLGSSPTTAAALGVSPTATAPAKASTGGAGRVVMLAGAAGLGWWLWKGGGAKVLRKLVR